MLYSYYLLCEIRVDVAIGHSWWKKLGAIGLHRLVALLVILDLDGGGTRHP